MALPDPKKTAPDNWTTYCVITGHLVAALRGQEEFSTAYHNSYLKEGRVGVRKRNAKQLEEALVDNLVGTPVQVERQLRRATKTGAWLTVQTSIVNSMELGAQECRYVLFLLYVVDPPDLPKFCNNCKAAFSVCLALNLKKGGLVTAHHNELYDKVADMSGKAFTPTHVCDYPLIFAVSDMHRPKAQPYGPINPPSKKKPEATE